MVWALISKFGLMGVGSFGTLLVLGYVAVTKPELLEKWYSIGTKIFASFSQKAELETVKHDIQSRVKGYQKIIQSEFEGALPYSLDIAWTTDETREAIIENDIVLVKMKPHTQQATNFLKVVTSYVGAGLIPQARKYVDEYVIRACEHTVAKNIFLREGKYNVFPEYMEELKKEKKDIYECCCTLDRVYEAGLFTKILLREFSHLGDRLALVPPNDYIFNETKDFTSNMGELAQKMILRSSEDIAPDFAGNYIRMNVILIKRETIERDGVAPYNRAIDFCVANDIYSIYIIAGGKMSVFAKLVAEEALKKYENIEKIVEKEMPNIYRGKPSKQIFIHLSVNPIEAG